MGSGGGIPHLACSVHSTPAEADPASTHKRRNSERTP